MIVRPFLILIATAAVTSCGLKGPLYLPESDAQQSTQDEEERKERTRDSGAPVPAIPTDTTSPPSSTPPPRN